MTMSSQQTADSAGSPDGSKEEEVKSLLSDEPEMCQADYEFFEWEDICECPRSITMETCTCQAYKAHREASASGAVSAADASSAASEVNEVNASYTTSSI